MRKIKAVLCVALCALFCLLGACGKKEDNLHTIKLLGNERTFSEASFQDPGKEYRPMPVIHDVLQDYQVDTLKDYGYGGVVTNVGFNTYLESDQMWQYYTDIVEYAIEKKDMRIWIYDELHYPSGAAGGLTLKNHPEWQARGLVNDITVVSRAGQVSVTVPYGHQLIFAKAFRGTSVDDMDLNSAVDLGAAAGGTVTWNAPGGGYIVITQYSKNFFEGTHAENNWAEVRRYINVLQAEPVQEFIRNTYEVYKQKVGKYFGKGIEAFFTDEPSMLGTYLSGPPTTPLVKDQPDRNIPLLPTVNFRDDINEVFQARRGYSLENLRQYLFAGDSDAAKRVRWDYYKTLGELMEENYTGQIAAWCEKNGIKASGHLLLEEDIFMHPVFNGNLLQNLARNQIPGTDLLTGFPSLALDWACTTTKFAASAAHYGNKDKVFTEISNAFDSTTSTMQSRVAAAAVQMAMGVNVVSSFYRPFQMTETDNRLFTDSIGRINYMMDKGIHESNVAVYYPIEGVYVDTLPPMSLGGFTQEAMATSRNFTALCKTLCNNQIDYDFMDSRFLEGCKIENGALVSPSGEQFKVVIVPKTSAMETAALDVLVRAAQVGVKVILQQDTGILSAAASGQNEFNSRLNTLKNSSSYKKLEKLQDIADELASAGVKSVSLKAYNGNILAVKQKYKNNSVFMFVNTGSTAHTLDVTLNETGGAVKKWDIYTGNAYEISATFENGQAKTAFGIPSESVVILTIE